MREGRWGGEKEEARPFPVSVYLFARKIYIYCYSIYYKKSDNDVNYISGRIRGIFLARKLKLKP